MSIADKLAASKNALVNLLAFANTKTGKDDTNIGDAIKTLCDGYGQGGGVVGVNSFIFNPGDSKTTQIINLSDNIVNVKCLFFYCNGRFLRRIRRLHQSV